MSYFSKLTTSALPSTRIISFESFTSGPADNLSLPIVTMSAIFTLSETSSLISLESGRVP
mgnify:CR=1 FL=1